MMLERIVSWWRRRRAERQAKRTRLWQHRLKVVPDFEQLEPRLQPSVNASFTASSYSVHELTGSVGVTVQLSGAVSATSSLHYATADTTAVAGTNYTSTSGTLNWTAGQSQSQVVSIPILHDSAATGAISFTISLSSPTGSIVLGTPSTATVNITDDDPIISYTANSYSVSAGSAATITVQLSTHPVSNLTVHYATADGTAVAGTDYTTTSGTLTFTSAGSLTQTYSVTTLADTYTTPGFNVLLPLSSLSAGSFGNPSEAVLNISSNPTAGYTPTLPALSTAAGPGVPAPPQVAMGPLAVDVETGNVHFAAAVPAPALTDPVYDDAGALSVAPALVYNSTTVTNVTPLFNLTWASSGSDPVPTNVKAQLTWNGTTGSWVTFTTGGVAAGDTYQISLVAPLVSTSGYYPYTIQLQANFSGAPTQVNRYVRGYLPVQVNGSTYGHGWNVAGVDSLVNVAGGELYLSGAGGARYFAYAGDHTYTSPAGDLGSLGGSPGGPWTYITPGKVVYHFNTSGVLTSVTDAHGLAELYAYSAGKVSTVTDARGFTYTFTYGVGSLKVTGPGGAATTFSYDGSSNLTTVSYATGQAVSFAYDGGGLHELVRATGGVGFTTMLYYPSIPDGTTVVGVGNYAYNGGWNSWFLQPRLIQGFAAALQKATLPTTVQDGRSGVTSYTLDSMGLPLTVQTPLATYTYSYNANEQVLTATDGDGNTTSYTYTGIDRTGMQLPGGALYTYTYSAAFHKLTSVEDPNGNYTTYTVNASTGDVTAVTDAGNNVTTYSWSTGLLQSVTNPLSQTTSYGYTANRQLQYSQDPFSNRLTYSYSAAGDRNVVTDPLNVTSTAGYDSNHRAVTVTLPDGGVQTTLYDAANRVTEVIDEFGVAEAYTYTSAGQQQTDTRYAGTGSAQTTTSLYDSNGNVTGVQDYLGNLTQYLYDGANRLQATVDTLGNRSTNLFDSNGNVTGVQDQYGQLTQYLYDSLNRATVTVDTLGNRTTSLFDAAGNMTGSLDTRGNLTQYLYDSLNRATVTIDIYGQRTTSLFNAAGQLTGTLDTRGNLTQYLYDSAGRQSVVIDVLGNRTTSLFNADGQVTESLAPDGGITQYLYDGQDRLSVTIDPLNHRTTTLFSSLGNVTGTLDANGNLTQFLFDSLNRQTVTIDAAGGRTTQLFNSRGQVSGALDARGNLTQYLYDSYGRQTVVIDVGSNRSTTLYDSYGRVSGSLDANGHLTQFLFDAYGRQSVTVDAASGRVTTLFNSYGEVSGTLDARGNLTQFVYDSYGRQSVTVDQANDRTTSLYNAYGEVSGTLDGNGNLTQFLYDSYGRASVTVDGAGDRVTSLYNSLGQVSGSLDGAGNLTQYVYDLLGRATVTIDGNNHRSTSLYDGNGNVTGVQDGNGNLTQYQFDALNRLTVSIDGNGSRTTQLYDANGNLTYVKDADNNVTTFAYNALNQKTSQTDPNSHTTTYSYTATGQLASTTDALGQRIDDQYDSLDRLTTQIWYNSGGTAVNTLTYSYDANSDMLTAGNSSGTYTMSYDAAGRVTLVQEPFGVTLTMTYDGAGNRTVVQDNFGTTTSTYDAANRLATVVFNGGGSLTPMRADLNYTGAGMLAGITRYSDVAGTSKVATSSYTYDGAGNITNLANKDSSGSNIGNFTWTYDAGNRLTSEQLNGGTLTTYSYDNASQLTNDGTVSYAYDYMGNRTSTNNGTTTQTYTTGTGNQVTSDGTWSYTYDANGNETKKMLGASSTTWVYGYDVKNELTSAKEYDKDPGSGGTLLQETDYSYDAFGNRIESDQVAGSVLWDRRYALDGWNPHLAGQTGTANWNVLADLDGGNNLTTHYLRGDVVDQLFAEQDHTGSMNWTVTDRQGSVRLTTTNSGGVQDSISYDGYGNVTESAPAYGGRYKWTGRELDVETGLQYNRARYYDATTGRWMTQDPLGFGAGDNNLYRYVNSEPTAANDPGGLIEMSLPPPPDAPVQKKGLTQAQKELADLERELAELDAKIGKTLTQLNVLEAKSRQKIQQIAAKIPPVFGGRDITKHLKNGLKQLEVAYGKLSRKKKQSVADYLYNVSGAIGWDITTLVHDGPTRFGISNPKDSLVPNPARETVTVDKAVYEAAYVNYVLWGKINRLLSDDKIEPGVVVRRARLYSPITLPRVLNAARAYRATFKWFFGLGGSIAAPVTFAEIGWNASGDNVDFTPALPYREQHLKPNPYAYNGDLSWRVAPFGFDRTGDASGVIDFSAGANTVDFRNPR